MPQRTSYAPSEFCWVDLASHGRQGAADFYCALLGWTAQETNPASEHVYSQFELDGRSVAGLGELDPSMREKMPPVWNSYVNVDDIHEAVRRGKSLGAKVIVPIMDAEGAGLLCFLQDPQGALIALWQKQAHFGAQLTQSPGSWCWSELSTRHFEDSCQFYQDWLGWRLEANEQAPGKYAMVHVGEQPTGGIMQMTEDWGDAPTHWGVYFSVRDVGQVVAKTEQLGGAVCAPAFDTPVGPMAVLTDNQGAVFSVIQLHDQTTG